MVLDREFWFEGCCGFGPPPLIFLLESVHLQRLGGNGTKLQDLPITFLKTRALITADITIIKNVIPKVLMANS
jgi:hypothetical protein